MATLGTFMVWKFLNVCYEHLYDPIFDYFIKNNQCNNYYIYFNNNYIQIGVVIKEFIKLIIACFILMIIYNTIHLYN